MSELFKIKNLRDKNDKGVEVASEELENFITETTHSKYDKLTEIKKEGTGKRPSKLKDLLHKSGLEIYDDFFLVSAVAKVNRDKYTRYMVLSEKDNEKLPTFFNDYIPVEYVERKGGAVSKLSSWFRNTMSSAFSFVDIDSMIVKGNKIIIIEEKNSLSCSVGYGQGLSYQEFCNQVLNRSKYQIEMLVVYNESNGNLRVEKLNKQIKRDCRNTTPIKGIKNQKELMEHINDYLNN